MDEYAIDRINKFSEERGKSEPEKMQIAKLILDSMVNSSTPLAITFLELKKETTQDQYDFLVALILATILFNTSDTTDEAITITKLMVQMMEKIDQIASR